MKHILYGDGVHDDLPAIQELLDSQPSVTLPAPAQHYQISGPIRLHSNQELRLGRFTRVVLCGGADCCMLENRDMKQGDQNIRISGGIWDMNHRNQHPNPAHFADEEKGEELFWDWFYAPGNFDPNAKLPANRYIGICMRFFNIKGFSISDVTIENPVTYGMDLAFVEDFTIEHITFDYFEGSPKLWNMDGVHIEGGCKNGFIHDLHGACHDDTVALTADDIYNGDIENITIDGIYGTHSHSAVRLLSKTHWVKNIHITNVYGTYYAYGVIVSKYSGPKSCRGLFSNIAIDHFYASLCEGTADVKGNNCALIHFGREIDVDRVCIAQLFRDETHLPLPTICVSAGCRIGCLSLSDCFQSNASGAPMELLENHGTIDQLIK